MYQILQTLTLLRKTIVAYVQAGRGCDDLHVRTIRRRGYLESVYKRTRKLGGGDSVKLSVGTF